MFKKPDKKRQPSEKKPSSIKPEQDAAICEKCGSSAVAIFPNVLFKILYCGDCSHKTQIAN